MQTLLIIIFILGYIAIATEHQIKVNKAASALLTGVLCWTIYFMSGISVERAEGELLHHLGEISSILFFLLGAMTIVELIDSHDGFTVITAKIKTKSKTRLLWIISLLTFFLSSLLDNLTTAIVMTSLLSKVLTDKNDRLWFVSMIIIAANAGGAFSPLGDVTTTMLWIGGQITADSIILTLFLPSIAVLLLPLFIVGFRFKGQYIEGIRSAEMKTTRFESNFVLILGVALLLFVPVFKIITHQPPFMGILLSLSIMWFAVAFLHKKKRNEVKHHFSVAHALEIIDTPSILFFLGILLSVSALQSWGLLKDLAMLLDQWFGNIYIVGSVLGVLSSVVDNVPLVAASQGMYDLSTYGTNHEFWKFLALTTGTGGSAIIIGSAAGVAAMGIEKIEFMWYLKKISWIALVGFLAGIGVYLLQGMIIG